MAGLVALGGSYAASRGAPFAARAALGLPLVTVLPGYVLSKLIFGARLERAERLLLSISLTLAIDILGGVFLSLSPWGIDTQSWAVLLGSTTMVLGLASTRLLPEEASMRWRVTPPPGSVPVALVAAFCVCVTAIAIAADRRPATPPSWTDGYTLFWLVPRGAGHFSLGLESGEFQNAVYRIELRSNGRLVHSWLTGEIAPSERWERPVQRRGGARLDAYLYLLGHGTTPYRHVVAHKARTS